MAVPIKSNNTQQGCNPISSNCVVWQGPNIPCINLCTGDSVSDVIAKMATELCDITSQTDISLLDLSCFNPLYPTPQNFRDVMQIILNKICALENPNAADGGVSTSGCPSDCEIAVAPCLQYTDNLGNTVTSLPIRDYVILIGNRICTILTSIANLQTQIDALDVRVTNLENNTGGGSGGSSSFNVTSDCLVQSSVSLQEYINLLDAAFCELQANSGTLSQFTSLSSVAACLTGSSTQLANPPAPMATYPGWIGSPTSAFQQIQNLWVAICDIRTGVTNLQEQLNACCAPEAACPTLPAPAIDVDKDVASSGKLFFKVTATTNASGNAVIAGEEWKLVRFEGTIIPSATGTAVTVNVTLPNSTLGSSVIDYSGTPNLFFQTTALGASLAVTVFGTFYWENVSTGQQCAVTPSNNAQNIRTIVAACPVLPPSPNASMTFDPPVASLTCNAVSGSTISISLNNFIPIQSPQVTTGSLIFTVSYTNTSNTPVTSTLTLTQNNASVSISNIICSSTVTVNLQSVSQSGITVACTGNFSIPIPLPPN